MEAEKTKTIFHDIETFTIFKVILILLFFVFLYLLRDIIVVLLFAIIIASGVTPFANWLDQKKFPRMLGVLLLYLSLFVLVIFLLSLVVPFVAGETNQLIKDLPNFIDKVSVSLEKAQQEGSSRYVDFFNEMLNLLDTFSSYLQASSRSAFGFVVSIFGGIFSFVAIVVISFYLSVMRGGIESFIRSVVPREYEISVLNVWRRSEKKVGRWIQGQLLLALIVGLTVYVVLSILGIKFALLLGILAMVLELVPNVGPVLAAVPAVILAFTQSTTLGLWVIAVYLIIQQLENHILVPIVLGRTVGLNPVVVILALLIGFKLAGILGMILSVPLAAIIVEILDEFSKNRNHIHTEEGAKQSL
ncbi:MAG: AI-2E family transporter [Candidatus Yanofskybacteria bacterium]|nr:AI-2E family transporter [Candidatus Yanofskybacteria bacterium]